MLSEIKYKNLTIEQIKRKSRAFIELFGKEPIIYVRGTFTDTKGNAVFLLSSSAQIDHIGRKHITLWINSDSEKIIVPASDNAEYNFSLW